MYSKNGKQRRHLRSLGHDLRVLVQIGKAGLTGNVIEQIENNLLAHELIKIKLPKLFGEDRKEFAGTISQEVNAEVVQIVGHNLLLYKPHPDKPTIKLPR